MCKDNLTNDEINKFIDEFCDYIPYDFDIPSELDEVRPDLIKIIREWLREIDG